MKLSVCLLTRNEDKNIAKALVSVAEIADEIIVADTGSTDRTTCIAAGRGAVVLQFPWEDDFAAGRNFTIHHAKSDWILWLNADEELDVGSQQELRACLDRPDAFGFSVLLHGSEDGENMSQKSETVDLRLFRRRPDLRFLGRLHPKVEPSFVAALARDGQRVYPSGIVLISHAASEHAESKLAWMARLLELELRDRPGQLHFLIEYGRVLLRLNNPQSHIILGQAIEQVISARDSPTPPTHNVQHLLEYLLSPAATQVASGLSQDDVRHLAVKWFPQSPRLLYLCAQHFFDHGDFPRAAELLAHLVQLGKSGSYDRSTRFPRGLIGDDALFNLASCYRRLEQLDKAEQCYLALLPSPRYQRDAAAELAAVRHLLTIRNRQKGK